MASVLGRAAGQQRPCWTMVDYGETTVRPYHGGPWWRGLQILYYVFYMISMVILRYSEAITQEDFHTPFMDLHMASMEFTRVINLLGGMLRGGELSPTLLFENDTLDELRLVCALKPLKLRCDSVCLHRKFSSVHFDLSQSFRLISAQLDTFGLC